MNIYEKLGRVQSELVVPKSLYSQFGKYHYRSLEDIYTALKPLLKREKLCLALTDSIENLGGRFYVKATATLWDMENVKDEALSKIVNVAYAREDETRKGMDVAQVTGSASTYARKYAVCGLFLADDNQDPDSMEHSAKNIAGAKQTSKQGQKESETLSKEEQEWLFKQLSSDFEKQQLKEILKRKKLSSTAQIKKSELKNILNEIKSVVDNLPFK